MLFQQTICLHTICLLREFIVFRQWHAHCNTNMHEKLTVHVVMFWETYKWGESWWSYELGPNFEGLLGWMEAPNQQAILGLKKHSCLSANSLLHNFESSLRFTRLSYAFFFFGWLHENSDTEMRMISNLNIWLCFIIIIIITTIIIMIIIIIIIITQEHL